MARNEDETRLVTIWWIGMGSGGVEWKRTEARVSRQKDDAKKRRIMIGPDLTEAKVGRWQTTTVKDIAWGC